MCDGLFVILFVHVLIYCEEGVESQIVELEPFPKAEVFEGDDLTLTCKVYWDNEWDSLKLRSSKNEGELIAFFFANNGCQNHADSVDTKYRVSCNIAKKEFSIHIENAGRDDNLTQILCEFVDSKSIERKNHTQIIIRSKGMIGDVSLTKDSSQTTSGGISSTQRTLKLQCKTSPSYPINISWHTVDDNGQTDIFDNACCIKRTTTTFQPGNVSMTTSTLKYNTKHQEHDDIGYCILFSIGNINDANTRFVLDLLYGQSTERILPVSTLVENKAEMIQFDCLKNECLVRVCSVYEISNGGTFTDGRMQIKPRTKNGKEITCNVSNETGDTTDVERTNNPEGSDLPNLNIVTVTTEADTRRGNHYTFGRNGTISLACFTSQRSNISWKFGISNQIRRMEMNTFSSLFTVNTCADIGKYHCSAENNFGAIQKKIYLMFECKPEIVYPDQFYVHETHVNGSISINFEYLAHPKPIIKMFRLSEKENVSTRVEVANVSIITESYTSRHMSVITIGNIEKFGLYVTVFENTAGKTEYLFSLKESLSTDTAFQVTVFYIIPISIGVLLLVAIGFVLMCILRCRYFKKETKRIEENERIYENDGRVIELAAELPYQDLKPQEEVALAEGSPYAEVEKTIPDYLEMVDYSRPVNIPRRQNTEDVDVSSNKEMNPYCDVK